MLRKFKLKSLRFVPFINTLMYRNLIASPKGRQSFYHLKYLNFKRFDSDFKSISDIFPFFYRVLRKFKSKKFKRKRRILFFKYDFVSHKYHKKFLKFRRYSILKKKKKFKHLFQFQKPLYFHRRFYLTQFSKRRTINLNVVIKSILSSTDITKKNRFLSYIKSKIYLNKFRKISRPFVHFYSSRFW